MGFEPENISKEHVLKAIEYIKQNDIKLNPSTGYDVIINGKAYPPKEIMRYSHAQMNGEKLWEYGGGEPTNKFLKKMGFEIKSKSEMKDPLSKLIDRYKERIRKKGLEDELYKWILTKKFHHRPDTNVPDFTKEITGIDYSNLIYQIGIAVKDHIAKFFPEELRQQFIMLFDETVDLQKRIENFSRETLKLYRKLVPDKRLSHHQDERTISTYLAFYDAKKYPLYKDSFYRKYCDLIGEKPKPKGHKYVHYMKLLDQMINDHILKDKELLGLIENLLPKEAFPDDSHYILAQDILYQMLDKKVEGDRNYWRIGTTDKVKSYWDLMLKGEYASIGWSELGDLTQKDIGRKEDIIRLMEEIGYYKDNKGLTSKKAREVYDFFFSMSTGDIILAQDGSKIKGIGIIKGDYFFQEDLDFPHTRPVDWKILEPSLINRQGLQTTVYKLTDPYLIRQIDKYLLPTMEKQSLNTILFGPPGTGKTYHTIDLAVKIAAPDQYAENDHETNKGIYDTLLEQGQIAFITFHQNMSYEDFIEGIKPLSPEPGDTYLKYAVEDGIFKKICADASTPNQSDFNEAFQKLQDELKQKGKVDLKTPNGSEFSISLNRNGNLNLHTGKEKKVQGSLTKENIQKQLFGNVNVFDSWEGYFYGVIDHLKEEYGYDPEAINKPKNFVLIIDEINRGNISQIFGELITLIEEDKRQGRKEELQVILPYSREPFMVPSNLYIIGTMNTADRSIEALDTALRRRFSFKEMPPNSSLIDTEGKASATQGVVDEINLVKLLDAINDRIEKLLDKDHRIGHSYFLNVDSLASLIEAFKNKVIPLLEEYFYGDYGKIGLVLGESFVKVKKRDEKGATFASFTEYDEDIRVDLEESTIYTITDASTWTKEDFRSIYEAPVK